MYYLNDVPHRNIRITLNDNGTFQYGNYGAIGWAFFGSGEWTKINENKILLKSKGVISKNDSLIASPQNYPINIDSALFNPRFTFPLINNDTMIFLKGNKSVLLEGYIFKLHAKCKCFDFSKMKK